MAAAPEHRERVKADDQLLHWEVRLTLAVTSHNLSANWYASVDRWLGGAGVALTAVVATGIFATITSHISEAVRIIGGLVTIGAAASTALAAFGGFGVKVAEQQQAARQHAAIRRRVEETRARLAAGEAFDFWREVGQIRVAIDKASDNSTNANPRLRKLAQRRVEHQTTFWGRLKRRVLGLSNGPQWPKGINEPRPRLQESERDSQR